MKTDLSFDERLRTMIIVPNMGYGQEWSDGQRRLSRTSIEKIKAEIAACLPEEKGQLNTVYRQGYDAALEKVKEVLGIEK